MYCTADLCHTDEHLPVQYAHIAMALSPGRKFRIVMSSCSGSVPAMIAGQSAVRLDLSEESGGNVMCSPNGSMASCSGIDALGTYKSWVCLNICKGRLLRMTTLMDIFGLQTCEKSQACPCTILVNTE